MIDRYNVVLYYRCTVYRNHSAETAILLGIFFINKISKNKYLSSRFSVRFPIIFRLQHFSKSFKINLIKS